MIEVPGHVIRAYRERLQLSQQDFANALDLSQSLISAVEVGRAPVSRKLLRTLRQKSDDGVLRPPFGEFLSEGGIDRGSLEADFGVIRPVPLEPWAARVNLVDGPDEGAMERVWVPGMPDAVRAFRFTPPPACLSPDTVAIFRSAALTDLAREQIVLLQVRGKYARRELVAGAAHFGRAIVTRKRGTIHCQFEPSVGNAPIIDVQERAIEALMVCMFRGRYTAR